MCIQQNQLDALLYRHLKMFRHVEIQIYHISEKKKQDNLDDYSIKFLILRKKWPL